MSGTIPQARCAPGQSPGPAPHTRASYPVAAAPDEPLSWPQGLWSLALSSPEHRVGADPLCSGAELCVHSWQASLIPFPGTQFSVFVWLPEGFVTPIILIQYSLRWPFWMDFPETQHRLHLLPVSGAPAVTQRLSSACALCCAGLVLPRCLPAGSCSVPASVPRLPRAPTRSGQLKLLLGDAGLLPFHPTPPAFPTQPCLPSGRLRLLTLSSPVLCDGTRPSGFSPPQAASVVPSPPRSEGAGAPQQPDSGNVHRVLCLGHLLSLGRRPFPSPSLLPPRSPHTSCLRCPLPRLSAAAQQVPPADGSSSLPTKALPG